VKLPAAPAQAIRQLEALGCGVCEIFIEAGTARHFATMNIDPTIGVIPRRCSEAEANLEFSHPRLGILDSGFSILGLRRLSRPE
jgi:hypothetical protein